ncbi:hypothetical protein HMN09_00858200 [Mycena chlorophos]|uniref:Uncharacterized protein n=1 Tax=Mycena chlorophos TaxID=658473 RepID=A0A8H6SV90_MYCCL|nr:hypothetical protein HMN09_00858200 [Mycena chlorophos]
MEDMPVLRDVGSSSFLQSRGRGVVARNVGRDEAYTAQDDGTVLRLSALRFFTAYVQTLIQRRRLGAQLASVQSLKVASLAASVAVRDSPRKTLGPAKAAGEVSVRLAPARPHSLGAPSHAPCPRQRVDNSSRVCRCLRLFPTSGEEDHYVMYSVLLNAAPCAVFALRPMTHDSTPPLQGPPLSGTNVKGPWPGRR